MKRARHAVLSALPLIGAASMALAPPTPAQAALVDRGGGRVQLVHAGDLGAAAPVDSPPTLPLVLPAAALALLARTTSHRASEPSSRSDR